MAFDARPLGETKIIHIKKGWNTVLLKIGPSLMVPTSLMFRVIDGHGATLRDLVYSSNQDTPQFSEPKELQLTVKVPRVQSHEETAHPSPEDRRFN